MLVSVEMLLVAVTTPSRYVLDLDGLSPQDLHHYDDDRLASHPQRLLARPRTPSHPWPALDAAHTPAHTCSRQNRIKSIHERNTGPPVTASMLCALVVHRYSALGS